MFESALILFADIGPRGFVDYRNDYFVETGTCRGGSIFTAIQSRFRRIYSIESDPDFYAYSKELFKRHPFVKIWHGDSKLLLWEMIQDIDRPITFWLDAHRFPPLDDGSKNCPLLEELEQIRRHPIKTHTILIDDMHCCGQLEFDYLSKEDLIAKILEINPEYVITFVDGGETGNWKGNVLVARVLF